jgi:hypothetical protein
MYLEEDTDVARKADLNIRNCGTSIGPDVPSKSVPGHIAHGRVSGSCEGLQAVKKRALDPQ